MSVRAFSEQCSMDFYRLEYWMNYTVDALRMLVSGQVGLKDLSGPVGIVAVVDDVYESAAPVRTFDNCLKSD